MKVQNPKRASELKEVMSQMKEIAQGFLQKYPDAKVDVDRLTKATFKAAEGGSEPVVGSDLSKTQISIMKYIQQHFDEYGIMPTRDDIQGNIVKGNGEPVSSISTVQWNINILVEKGYLLRHEKMARGLKILKRVV